MHVIECIFEVNFLGNSFSLFYSYLLAILPQEQNYEHVNLKVKETYTKISNILSYICIEIFTHLVNFVHVGLKMEVFAG